MAGKVPKDIATGAVGYRNAVVPRASSITDSAFWLAEMMTMPLLTSASSTSTSFGTQRATRNRQPFFGAHTVHIYSSPILGCTG